MSDKSIALCGTCLFLLLLAAWAPLLELVASLLRDRSLASQQPLFSESAVLEGAIPAAVESVIDT